MNTMLLNPFIVAPGGIPLPRTNMATTPRASARNTGSKNEMGPSTNNYWHGTYTNPASGGPGDGPASYARKTLNTSPWPASDTRMNITNQNMDTANISPGIAGVDVSASTDYMLSVWIRASKACTPEVIFNEHRTDGAQVSYTTVAMQAVAASTWTRVNTILTTTSTTAILTLGLGASNGSWANADTFDWTGLLFEQINLLGDYFDGSMTGCSWVGTADDSRSTKTS